MSWDKVQKRECMLVTEGERFTSALAPHMLVGVRGRVLGLPIVIPQLGRQPNAAESTKVRGEGPSGSKLASSVWRRITSIGHMRIWAAVRAAS
eukprot:3770597-Amphidinium_carterae.1